MFFELFKSSKLHENGIIDETKLLNEFKNYKSKIKYKSSKIFRVLVSSFGLENFSSDENLPFNNCPS